MFELEQFIKHLVTGFPWLVVFFAFVLGTIIGSYLNVCIYRLPLEKSLFWPGSRCSNCFAKIRFLDNVPLIGYIRLGGRCRTCGAQFSGRYFFIELLTGVIFASLFYLEVVENWGERSTHKIGMLMVERQVTVPTWSLIVVWACHSVFVSLLLVATFTDIDHWEIPLAITIPGTILGIVCATLGPWPWPVNPADIDRLFSPGWHRATFGGWGMGMEMLPLVPSGMYRWPVFLPLPDWLPPGSWQLGLATSLVGAAVGTLGMRLIRLIFSWGLKKEAMGLGDADLMMMIGAFLGWQALLFVLIGAVLLGLIYAIILVVRNKGYELPFGPFLAGGALLALVTPWVYPISQSFFFDWRLVLIIAGVSTVLALCLTLSIRMARLIWEAA
jgi:leader peptidase (prepilin peptidase) / N-methyltransferase